MPTELSPSALDELRRDCRGAYERGRLRHGLLRTWPLIPMVAVSLLFSGHATMALAGGIGLLIFGPLLFWRGGAWARAWYPGLLAGSVPLLLPVFVHALGRACPGCDAGPGSTFCVTICVVGGLLAGGLAGAHARKISGAGEFVLGTLVVAGLAGLLGCGVAGYAGLLGLMGGLLGGATPVLIAKAARS